MLDPVKNHAERASPPTPVPVHWFPPPLRPLPVLRTAWFLYRQAFGTVAFVAALLAPPMVLVEAFAELHHLQLMERYQLTGLVALVLGTLGNLVLARTFWCHSRGAETDGVLAFALARWPSAIGVALLLSMMESVGLFLLVVPALLVAATLSLTGPLLATTLLDANRVIRRSRDLATGRRWKLLFLFALAAPFSFAPSLLGMLVPGGTGPIDLVFGVAVEFASGLGDAFFTAVAMAAFSAVLAIDEEGRRAIGPALI